MTVVQERGKWVGKLTAIFYDGDVTPEQIAAGDAVVAINPVDGLPWAVEADNLLVNSGIQLLEDLLIGAGGTAYNNANSYLGVGSGAPTTLTGTLSVTNGSATVTGAGTNFTGQITVGDYVKVDTDGTWYRVTAIASNTSLTIAVVYAGTTASGQAGTREALAASQTDLQASTNKFKKAMDATFPSRASQTISWRTTYATTEANFAINEIGTFNGGPAFATGTMLNRVIAYLGTKSALVTLQLTMQVTVS